MEPSTADLGDEMWDLKSTGIFLLSLLGAEIRIYTDNSMRPHGLSGRTINRPCSDYRSEVYWSTGIAFGVRTSLEFYPLCDIVSCSTPRGIESAVAVLRSEFLSVCVIDLCCPPIDIKIKEENEIWQQQQVIKNLEKIGISFNFAYATESPWKITSIPWRTFNETNYVGINVFTDGSKINNRVGCAMVVFEDGMKKNMKYGD
ncbi:hypothetical protein AVEN_162209-1 [Araneus ventricosus]|uniref:RNase H type-1 domain-containing protein n=1 Tax=Araneus ventricosus TaxID=182803 RepID=A0A4Y2FI52_ARAVE|nr:hypothetical protein AVEN_162209-1 [Araneus ventricosus]